MSQGPAHNSSRNPRHKRKLEGNSLIAFTALILAAVALAVQSASAGSGALLSKERMLVVNGNPRFTLGLCELTGNCF